MRTLRDAPIEWVSTGQARAHDEALELAMSLAEDGTTDGREGFPRDVWERLAGGGVHALPVGEPYGRGAGAVATALALEALGYGGVDSGLLFSVNAHMWGAEIPIATFGTPEQKERWLPALVSGGAIGGHAATEPQAGSDVYAMDARATRTADGWALTGAKSFVTNAPVADVLVVLARTGGTSGPLGLTAFLVETAARGCAVGTNHDKLGLGSSPIADVALEDCRVAETAVLGRVGRGADVFETSMRWERACIGASQVGTMRRTMDKCVEFARTRRQFGRPIADFESVADKIANMKIAIDASRALVLRAAWLLDDGGDAATAAAVAKTFVTESSVRVHLDALQVHGGRAYLSGSAPERNLRDALAGTLYSGTSEMQRRIIARGVGL